MRLIDADELIKDIMSYKTMPEIRKAICEVIDNAPAVEPENERALDLIDSLRDRYAINNREKGILRRAILLNEKKRACGKWINHPIKEFKEWDICTACGIGCRRRVYEYNAIEEYNYPFCPNCGAQMYGGEAHD